MTNRKARRATAAVACAGAALLLAGSCVRGPAAPGPVVSDAVSTTPFRAERLHMVSGTQGWIVGGRQVLRTDDGGRTWTEVTPAELLAGVSGAFFLDGNHGWVASGTVGHDMITIERTADGGRTWRGSVLPDTFPDGHGPVSVSFVDVAGGWLMTTRPGLFPHGVAFRTTDGGATWTRATPARAELNFSGPLAFSSGQTGWAVDQMVDHHLFVTSDGGSTWRTKGIPVPRGERGAEVTFDPPTFLDQSNGVLVASFRRHDPIADLGVDLVFYVTRDGGDTWTPAGRPLTDPAFLNYVDVNPPTEVVDRTTWFVGTINGGLRVTHDGGSTWRSVTPGRSLTGLDQIDFVNADVGWALLGNGGDCAKDGGDCAPAVPAVVETTDGGLTWTPRNPTVGS